MVADLILGTSVEGGGPSVFERYKTVNKNQELYEHTHAAMVDKRVVGQAEPSSEVEAEPKPISQAEVHKEVAARSGRSIEKVRKNFEAHERGLGCFAIGALRRAKKQGGVGEM